MLSRRGIERRTCCDTKAVLDARMVLQPGTQKREDVRLVNNAYWKIDAIEEETTTTAAAAAEEVLVVEDGLIIMITGPQGDSNAAMIAVEEEILENEEILEKEEILEEGAVVEEVLRAVRVSTAENLDTSRETARSRDKEILAEAEVEVISKTEAVEDLVVDRVEDTAVEEVGVAADEANDGFQTKTERRGEISKTTTIDGFKRCFKYTATHTRKLLYKLMIQQRDLF
mmetsp:Transcript_4039/g.13333  ORF Transcript_4039/g.13333 Transcript_4039/m.13333 type:complete len:228 (+) Transcript_4039:1296-1979(+)